MPLLVRNKDLDQSIFQSRVILLSLIIIGLCALLLLKAFQLQVIKHIKYEKQSQKNIIRTRALMPHRGLIYDREGVLIANNVSQFTLDIIPEEVHSIEESLRQIEAIVPLSEFEKKRFYKRLSYQTQAYAPVELKSFLDVEVVSKISVRQYHMPGVSLSAKLIRSYPYGDLYAHSLGSVRRIHEKDQVEQAYKQLGFVGRLGVEKFYETELRGIKGIETIEVDALGNIHRILSKRVPINGLNLVLTLDHRLQKKATELLSSHRGALVALNPNNGEVLAMVSLPSYDPNLFIRGVDQKTYDLIRKSKMKPLFNRAVAGQYAPGSTVKPMVGLIALSANVIDWEYSLMDKGVFKIPNEDRIFRDWSWTISGGGGHGLVNLNKAIYRSSNIFFYDLATKINPSVLQNGFKQFGLGNKLGIDIVGGQYGLIPDEAWKQKQFGSKWFTGDTLNISIGQGSLLVTPLHLANVAVAFANKGVWYEPFLMKEMKDWQGNVLKKSKPVKHVIDLVDEEDWERMQLSMRDVIHKHGKKVTDNGTAWAYAGQNMDYLMAGKSGTAQVVKITQNKEYDADELDEFHRKHAWFIAFAPLEKPRIAVALIVENGGGGSSVAAPIVRELFDFYIKDLEKEE